MSQIPQAPSKLATREEVVAEALSYLGTPYHKGAMLKGVGVDCATFLFLVFKSCGFVAPSEEQIFADESIVPRSQDWYCNTLTEKYMRQILRHAHKVAEGISYYTLDAAPGNMVLTRAVGSKVYNHGGIVVSWPTILHAVSPVVERANATSHYLWAFQDVMVLDPFKKAGLE